MSETPDMRQAARRADLCERLLDTLDMHPPGLALSALDLAEHTYEIALRVVDPSWAAMLDRLARIRERILAARAKRVSVPP